MYLQGAVDRRRERVHLRFSSLHLGLWYKDVLYFTITTVPTGGVIIGILNLTEFDSLVS